MLFQVLHFYQLNFANCTLYLDLHVQYHQHHHRFYLLRRLHLSSHRLRHRHQLLLVLIHLVQNLLLPILFVNHQCSIPYQLLHVNHLYQEQNHRHVHQHHLQLDDLLYQNHLGRLNLHHHLRQLKHHSDNYNN